MKEPPVTQVNERRQPLTDAEHEWLRVRNYLREHRFDLSVQASDELYADLPRVAGTPLLTDPRWMPAQPIPLGDIALDLDVAADPFAPRPPFQPNELPFSRYSEAVAALSAPAVFENRTTYRLLDADLSIPRMSFGLGHYFDGMDTGEIVGHEFAAQKLNPSSGTSVRTAIDNPVDPSQRPTNVAISALTIRHDSSIGESRFLLHWRDPAKVGHAGGLYQVIPVGIFQPATEHPDSVRNDFSLWRCLVREFAEELLGEAEPDAGDGQIDYDAWPFAADLDAERRRGSIRVSYLGMGVDPLTLATDLLCVTVIDAPVFDHLFAALVSGNTEGELTGCTGGQPGVRFVAEEVERLTRHEPMQAAGAAVLALAWQQRAALLA